MRRSAYAVFENVRGLLNAALIAREQMKAARCSTERDHATQRYVRAVDELVAELEVLKRAHALDVIAEFLCDHGRGWK